MVERFVRDGQEVRLTQAALETLAVVAYRQPVSRARVSAVRGVNCDGVMRTLTLRGLVEEAGTEHETGAILYRTTGTSWNGSAWPAWMSCPSSHRSCPMRSRIPTAPRKASPAPTVPLDTDRAPDADRALGRRPSPYTEIPRTRRVPGRGR